MADAPIAIAGVVRPHPAETVSGDAWTVQWHDGVCRIAVIDALGHGPEAAKVAVRAVEALQQHPDLAPVQALHICNRALAGSRGAAISIAALDPTAATLTFAGIGNVEAQLFTPTRTQRPVVFRGIVGGQQRTVRAQVLQLAPNWVLFMHSDGVSTRAQLDQVIAEHQRDNQPDDNVRHMAQSLVDQWSRNHDDATAVIATARA